MSRPALRLCSAAAALTALVTLGACSSSGGSSSPSSSSAPTTSSASVATSGAGTSSAPATASSSAATTSAVFGSGCASLGITPALAAEAAQAPVGTVAAGAPFLSHVLAAAQAAGLVNTFNTAPALTVFAPVDTAFAKENPATLQALLTDPSKKPELIATLKYHVLAGEVAKAQLVGKHKTMEGSDITITGSGDNYTINGKAKIVCGGIQAKNAVVYLIDTVLHPAS